MNKTHDVLLDRFHLNDFTLRFRTQNHLNCLIYWLYMYCNKFTAPNKSRNFSFLPQELDIPSETIVLADTQEDVAPNDLKNHVPGDRGRYVFYVFKHTFEGDYLESISKRTFHLSLAFSNVLYSFMGKALYPSFLTPPSSNLELPSRP